jgi:hypothetical protein
MWQLLLAGAREATAFEEGGIWQAQLVLGAPDGAFQEAVRSLV